MTTLAAPVRWDADLGAHVVTGFEQASTVLRTPGWSSDPRNNPNTLPEFTTLPPATLLFLDPPDHTRLRRLVSPAFTPRAIERLRPRVRAVAAAAIDAISDRAEVDLVNELAYVIPLAIIAELLDVGTDGADLLHEHTPSLVRLLEIDAGVEDLAAAAAASMEITFFVTPLIAERRRRPGEDFISALLTQPELNLDEVLATTMLLLAAGHETTANLIANATYGLLRAPDQIPALHADPSRAVEELLRLEGPVRLIARTALIDQQIDEHRVRAGEMVLIQVEDVNRDPGRFPEPQRLDLSRVPVGHLGFGAGAHFCLGAALARLEAAETLPELFARNPRLRLTDQPIHRRRSTTFRALETLPVNAGR